MIPLEIYTDGSSTHNGKPNCYAGWAMCIPNFNGKTFIRYGHLPPPSSNNKGEILGVLWALRCLSKQTRFKPIIYTDSQYVEKSLNQWRHKWKLTNYDGIKNRALLLPLFELYDNALCHPEVRWVKGHNGLAGNELADEWCGRGAKQTILEKVDSLADIQFVDYRKIPYDLTSP